MTRNCFWKMPTAAAALVFAAALAVTACGGNGTPGGSGLGETLTLSGQVYTMAVDMDTMRITYTPFTGDMAGTARPTGDTGQITAGQLNLTLGTPTTAQMGSVSFMADDFWRWDNVTVTPDDALFVQTWLDVPYGALDRGYASSSLSGNTLRGTTRDVQYIFVDRDVAVRGTGRVFENDGWRETTRNFNFTLRRGWNAVHFLVEESLNLEAGTGNTTTTTVSLSNPGYPVRWVLEEWEWGQGGGSEVVAPLFSRNRR